MKVVTKGWRDRCALPVFVLGSMRPLNVILSILSPFILLRSDKPGSELSGVSSKACECRVAGGEIGP